ncbi:trehalose-6-phosphate hydrolase [Actinobacillus pleuropneumoniae]|nr:trehalose-6-phosphate hydrolase [Actinobacillus pleuropneumoniae]
MDLARAKSRDYSRSPMQWNGDRYGGFSEQAPWIGMGPGHEQIHVQAQREQPDSMYSFYKKLLSLRLRHAALSSGDYVRLEQLEGSAIAYTKRSGGEEVVIVLHFGDQPLLLDLSDWSGQRLELAAASGEMASLGGSVIEVPPHTAAVWIS